MENLSNPCHCCMHHQAGGDKNIKTCIECPPRFAYVDAIDHRQPTAPTPATLIKEIEDQSPHVRICPRCQRPEGQVCFNNRHHVCQDCFSVAVRAGAAKKRAKKRAALRRAKDGGSK